MKKAAEVSPVLLDRAATLVRRRTGLVFGDARVAGFATSLVRAMQRNGFGNPGAYLEQLERDPVLLDDLIVDITVGETYFFRDQGQLTLLSDQILPGLAGAARDRELRLWSAGCATGEEAYTLAIMVEAAGLAGRCHVIGSDVSRTALEKARRASYTRWSLRGVGEDVVQRYFLQAHGRFDLRSSIRDAVEFRYLNLAEDRYPSLVSGIGNMDVILCRNVLIYFDTPTIAAVARRLIACLSVDGWLLLGAADPPLRDLVPCDVVMTDAGLAYRRPRESAASSGLPPEPRVRTPAPPRVRPPSGGRQSTRRPPAAVAAAAPAGEGADARDDPARAAARGVRTLAGRGELLAADAACQAALKQHPLDAELVYLHAVLLTEAGRHEHAAATLRRALYLDRTLVVAHIALGDVLARLHDTRGADRVFANAERLLKPLPASQVLAASDDETAGRLLTMVRARRALLSAAA